MNIQSTGIARQRRFVLLATARTTSVLGNGFGRVALAFGVLAQPGSTGADLSLVLACQAAPQLVFILLGGVIADRVSRARLMVGAELLAGAAWAALSALVFAGSSQFGLMAAGAVMAGLATAMFTPAMTGLVPELVDEAQLQAANAAIRLGQNIALMVGLAAAGVVVAVVGAGWALAINAISFVVSGLLIHLIGVPRRSGKPATGIGSDFLAGGKEFFSRQWLWVIAFQYAFVVAAINATVGVLGPLLSEQHYNGARDWSLLVGAQAVGTVAGAAGSARIAVPRPLLMGVIITFPVALPMVLLATHAHITVLIGGMFISGIAVAVFGVLWSTTLQQRVPGEVLSRVSSYDLFGALAFAPLGLLVAGPLATALGTEPVLWGCGGLVVLSSAAALTSAQVRNLRSSTPPEPEVKTGRVPSRRAS